jgi:hypothetical protein
MEVLVDKIEQQLEERIERELLEKGILDQEDYIKLQREMQVSK